MSKDEIFIKRCLEIAPRSGRNVGLNPHVGSVLVHENRIIGEGIHEKYGGPHAEVNCLASVTDEDRHLIPFSTLYVSLEPCFHTGKTPPCVDLILKNKIPRVVISTTDPNPVCQGNSVNKLRENGVEVNTDILREEGRFLNRMFRTRQLKNRPYIVLKFAQSKNFMMGSEAKQVWISNQYSNVLVHKWRSELDGILVGTNTVLTDNPSLTTRHYPGPNPVRITYDRHERITPTSNILDGQAPSIVFTNIHDKRQNSSNNQYVPLDSKSTLANEMTYLLTKKRIGSILVEGGPTLLKSFIDANLWDEARIITGYIHIENGIKAPSLHGDQIESYKMDSDKIDIIVNRS